MCTNQSATGEPDEKDFSAQQPQKEAYPRLPGANGDPSRASDYQTAPPEGPKASDDRKHSSQAAGLIGSSPILADHASRAGAATLPKSARVRKRREFLAHSRAGRRSTTEHFLVVRGNAEREQARLGITVTKKIGGAVVRNRIKRRVREAFRHMRTEMAPYDVVVIARRGSDSLGSDEIANELGPALLGPGKTGQA